MFDERSAARSELESVRLRHWHRVEAGGPGVPKSTSLLLTPIPYHLLSRTKVRTGRLRSALPTRVRLTKLFEFRHAWSFHKQAVALGNLASNFGAPGQPSPATSALTVNLASSFGASGQLRQLVQGDLYEILSQLLRKSHGSKLIFEWKEYLKMLSYNVKKRRQKFTRSARNTNQ